MSSPSLIGQIAEKASPAQQLLVSRYFRKIVQRADPSTSSTPVSYIGSLPAPYNAATDESQITANHWITWRVCGEPCVIFQMKPRKSRRRASSSTTAAKDDNDDDDDDTSDDDALSADDAPSDTDDPTSPQDAAGDAAELCPAEIKLFILTPDNELYVLRRLENLGVPRILFRRYNNATKEYTYPSIALQGEFALRLRHNRLTDGVRAQTLASMGGSAPPTPRRTVSGAGSGEAGGCGGGAPTGGCGGGAPIGGGVSRDLVFFASECLWSRVYRGNKDMQTRMAQARTIVEGEPYVQAMLVVNHDDNAVDPLSSLHVAYKPHMTALQAHAVTHDVPEVLRGVELCGVEMRPSDGLHVPAGGGGGGAPSGLYIDRDEHWPDAKVMYEAVIRYMSTPL